MNTILYVCKHLLQYGCSFRKQELNDKSSHFLLSGDRYEFSFNLTTLDEIIFVLRDNKFSVYFSNYAGSVYRLPNFRVTKKFSLPEYVARLRKNTYVKKLSDLALEVHLNTELHSWYNVYKDGYSFEAFVDNINSKRNSVYNFTITNSWKELDEIVSFNFKLAYFHNNSYVQVYTNPFLFDEEEAELSFADFKKLTSVNDLLDVLPSCQPVYSLIRTTIIDEFLNLEENV